MHIALLVTAFALQGGGTPPAQRPRATVPARPDSIVFLDSIVAAERRFFSQWRTNWIRSEQARRRSEAGPWFDPSKADLSCNADPAVYVPDNAWGANTKVRQIRSAQSALSVCPNWFPPPGFFVPPPKNATDERLGIDGALAPQYRREIATARDQLIATLEKAVAKMPESALLTGQLVRVLVDQGRLDRAAIVTRDCRALAWWCNALTGYVLARQGNMREAERFLAVAETGLADADRCNWTDVGVLLAPAGRSAYAKLMCEDRLLFNERFWWLSDALWIDSTNDRRAEQSLRQVATILHASLARDERYDWRPVAGGDALEETVKRYGWPTYTYWGPGLPAGLPPPTEKMRRLGTSMTPLYQERKVVGDFMLCEYDAQGRLIPYSCAGLVLTDLLIPKEMQNPAGEFRPPGSLNVPDPAALGAPPPTLGTTMEYSVGRVHLVPAWRALDDPFQSVNTDWDLNAPRKDPIAAINWWPQEHYAPEHPIRQFVDQQTAVLRRQTGALLAFATSLGQTDLGRESGETIVATLLTSTGPDSISRITQKHSAATSLLTFLEPLPIEPAVVSIEIPPGVGAVPAGRTRFGVTPPRPLGMMAADAKDISQPVLLAAPPSVDALPLDPDAAVATMLGSTVIQLGTPRFGVYWETYGFAAGDTVDVALRVTRVTPLSVLQRAAVTTGVMADPNAPVVTSWKEPDQVRRVRTVPGDVPIQMRSVAIDISTLVIGDYVLEVSVGKPGAAPAKSQREFVIR